MIKSKLCSVIVIAILCSAVFFNVMAVKAATNTFGNTNVGSSTNYFGTDKDATRFYLNEVGVAQSISAYFANSGFSAKAAIYTDSGGVPGNLVTQSSSQNVGQTGWNTFGVSAISLNPGYYWICVVSSSSAAIGRMSASSANDHYWKASSYSSEFTSSFGVSVGYEATKTSIYVTYSSSAQAPTPAPSPTPSPSTPATSPSSQSYFGNNNVGSLANYFETDKDASRFRLSEYGTVQSISAYFAAAGFNSKAAIYSDSNGVPANLLAQSSSNYIGSVGWTTFSVPDTALNVGYYWLSVVSSSSAATGRMSTGTANQHSWKSTTFGAEFVYSFGAPTGYESTATSIYATYVTSSSGSSPPTAPSTPTPTPAPLPSTTGLLMGMGHPSWAFDRNSQPLDIRGLVNLAAASGANSWREAMYVGGSVSSYQTNLKSYLDAAGMKLIIQTLSSSVGAMSTQEELNIINNVGGAQTSWINSWGSKIAALWPYGIMVMNEPTNGGTHSTASASAFASYRQFCINAINTWRQIKPDLVIVVNNDPFNDFFDSTSYGFAANPLPFSNILYGRHIYYAYYGYPPSYLPDQQSYWNGNTALGKQQLTALIDGESKALLAKGQQVIWDEWGANIYAPNAQAYTRDFISICRSRGISTLYYSFVPASYEATGLLNEDYKSLNAIGWAWANSIS
jgi:hypothetical protein